MEDSTNPPKLPSNCSSPVCSDPAHDDLALHAEWSDESSDCVGDGPHRDGQDDREDRDDPEDPDDLEEDEECREVQDDLLSFSGAPAPEILTGYSVGKYVLEWVPLIRNSRAGEVDVVEWNCRYVWEGG